MVAYLNLHSGLAKINVAAVVQFKAHDAPPKPGRTEKTLRSLEAIRALVEGGPLERAFFKGRQAPAIGIGGSLAAAPLPHHRTYGSVSGGSGDERTVVPRRRKGPVGRSRPLAWR
jgi:hypothetical protein